MLGISFVASFFLLLKDDGGAGGITGNLNVKQTDLFGIVASLQGEVSGQGSLSSCLAGVFGLFLQRLVLHDVSALLLKGCLTTRRQVCVLRLGRCSCEDS